MKIAYRLKKGIPYLLLHQDNTILYEFMVPNQEKLDKVVKFYQLAVYLDSGQADLIIKENKLDEAKQHLERNFDMYETL